MNGTAIADRVQVFSVQGSECGNCEEDVAPYLKKLKGVKTWSFDAVKFEFTITLADNVPDQAVVAAFERQGCYRAVPGTGHGAKPGAYKTEPYPEGADVATVAHKGESVGPLEKLRVPGKYTVLDFYADWCGPCRVVDQQLREILGAREDVAVRKLNVVDFESPLARQLGRKLKVLPYVVVFDPSGKRTEISGSDPKKIARALGVPDEAPPRGAPRSRGARLLARHRLDLSRLKQPEPAGRQVRPTPTGARRVGAFGFRDGRKVRHRAHRR